MRVSSLSVLFCCGSRRREHDDGRRRWNDRDDRDRDRDRDRRRGERRYANDDRDRRRPRQSGIQTDIFGRDARRSDEDRNTRRRESDRRRGSEHERSERARPLPKEHSSVKENNAAAPPPPVPPQFSSTRLPPPPASLELRVESQTVPKSDEPPQGNDQGNNSGGPSTVEAEASTNTNTTTHAAEEDAATDDENEIPITLWKQVKDVKGRFYYYHSATRETVWEPPEEWLRSQLSAQQASSISEATDGNIGFKEVNPSEVATEPSEGDLVFNDDMVVAFGLKTKKKKDKTKSLKAQPVSSLFSASSASKVEHKQVDDEEERARQEAMATMTKPIVLSPTSPKRGRETEHQHEEPKRGISVPQPQVGEEAVAMEEDVDELELLDRQLKEQSQQDIKLSVKKARLKPGKDASWKQLWQPAGKERSKYGGNVFEGRG